VARVVRSPRLAAVGAAAFLVLAALVTAGVFTGIDRYSVRHLMPWLQPSTGSLVNIGALFLPETRPSLGGSIVGLWTYPASPFVSALVIAACAYVADRRGNRRAAAGMCVLWLVANVVELIGKLAIARPAIGIHRFQHSYPSGHTLRACVIAAVVTWTWHRAGPAVAAWALLVSVALVLLGDHTPTDVVGGLALAGCLIALWGPPLLERNN
jgi:membrane-associated phospholipid phosphatase